MMISDFQFKIISVNKYRRNISGKLFMDLIKYFLGVIFYWESRVIYPRTITLFGSDLLNKINKWVQVYLHI